MKLLRTCRINFFHWKTDLKYPFSLLYLILYMWYATHGFVTYARQLQYPIAPYLFPFLPASTSFVYLLIPFVLIISDAPFRNQQQLFILLRVGKRTWIASQLLYLLICSSCYTLLIWILSWLFLIPQLEWSTQWGPVITTAAVNGGYSSYSTLSLEYGVMKGIGPISATMWVAFVMIAVCFLLGIIMTLCNLWFQKGLGTVIISCFAILPLIINVLAHTPRLVKKLLWISPVSWMDRNLMGNVNQNLPSYMYGLLAPVLISILLTCVIYATIHRCDLERTKE